MIGLMSYRKGYRIHGVKTVLKYGNGGICPQYASGGQDPFQAAVYARQGLILFDQNILEYRRKRGHREGFLNKMMSAGLQDLRGRTVKSESAAYDHF